MAPEIDELEGALVAPEVDGIREQLRRARRGKPRAPERPGEHEHERQDEEDGDPRGDARPHDPSASSHGSRP